MNAGTTETKYIYLQIHLWYFFALIIFRLTLLALEKFLNNLTSQSAMIKTSLKLKVCNKLHKQ